MKGEFITLPFILHHSSFILSVKCLEPELNQRHMDFQSIALPTELSRQNDYSFCVTTSVKMADPTGFEPAISSVTGRHVGPLHHGSVYELKIKKVK